MKILIKLTRSLFKEAEKNAEKAIKHFDADSIHKMRVALKKIRAEFNLLLFFSQGKLSEKDIQKVKGTFKKAGTVRELQLVISSIESLPQRKESPQKVVLEYFKKREKKSEKKFHDYFKEKGEKELSELKKIMLDESKNIQEHSLTPYFENLSNQIMTLQKKEDRTEEELHELRKRIKELKYNLEVLGETDRTRFENLFPPKKLDKLEEVIGEWHDEMIFRSRIEKVQPKVLSEIPDVDLLNELQNFFSQLRKKSDRELQKELKKTEGLLAKSLN